MAIAPYSKKEIRNAVFEKIDTPLTLKEISRIATLFEQEEYSYSFACNLIILDAAVTKNEQEFLEAFGKELGLTKFDIRSIEKQIKSQL